MAFARETIVGNVGRVYEKRQVGPENRSVIDFSIAMTPRKNVNGEWVDGDTYWMTCTAWGRLADNIQASFKPGDRVFVQGKLGMKAGYTNKEGVNVEPRPFLTVDAAGHEISIFPSEYKKGGGASGASQPAKKAAPQRQRPQKATQPAQPEVTDDFDIGFELDDFGDDYDSVGTPF